MSLICFTQHQAQWAQIQELCTKQKLEDILEYVHVYNLTHASENVKSLLESFEQPTNLVWSVVVNV